MTHPHRVNTTTPWDVTKSAFWGFVQALLSVGIPVLLVWYFFGHLLPVAEQGSAPKSIETSVGV